MPVIAVINRKGGSGKSTLATHLAAAFAASGLRVMLGDVDRQQSSLAWLRRRAAAPEAAPVAGWAADARSVLRPPAGVTHVVLDTPGGLRGFELARVALQADVILVPTCHSAFDREAAADCCTELMALPRVASGRCKLGLVGMRLDARTKADAQLADWAAGQGLPYVGSLRETQAYVRSSEQGLTLFDLPATKVDADLAQWQPIIDWVQAAWAASDRADSAARATVKPTEGRAETVPRAPQPPAERAPHRPTQRPIDRPGVVAVSTAATPSAVATKFAPSFGHRLADRLQQLVSAWRPAATPSDPLRRRL